MLCAPSTVKNLRCNLSMLYIANCQDKTNEYGVSIIDVCLTKYGISIVNWPVYEILVLIAYAHKPASLHAQTGAYNRDDGLKFSLSLRLHPNCVRAISKGSDELSP